MRIIHRDIVSALLFSKDGKLFQGKKDSQNGGVYIDCWHIPGGGINEGEDKLTTLQREILEETGIDITPYNPTLIDDHGYGESKKTLKTGEQVLCKMHFFVYRVVITDRTADQIAIILTDDLKTYHWTDVDELSRLPLTPPSIELFTRLGYLQ